MTTARPTATPSAALPCFDFSISSSGETVALSVVLSAHQAYLDRSDAKMASVNVCRCPGGVSAQREPLLNLKSEQCGDIRNTDSCRPTPVPDPCKSLEKPQTFGLNLNLETMTGQDYSSSTGCQLVRSANIIEWDQMNDRKVFGARSDKENSEM